MSLTIDHQKCIGCGACVSDCLQKCLALEDGLAVQVQNTCNACGHCVAICPAGAVAIPDCEMDLVEELRPEDMQMDPVHLQRFMSGRRSIRQFQNRSVEREKLEAILETGRMTPTSSNRQNLRFVVLQDKLPELREMAVEALGENADEIAAQLGASRYRDKLLWIREELHRGNDRLFFEAPAVIVVIERGGSVVNGALAASRMELMAVAQGLGVCFNGFFVWAASVDPRIPEALGCGEQDNIVTTLAVGYPDVNYCRTAPRKKLRVSWL